MLTSTSPAWPPRTDWGRLVATQRQARLLSGRRLYASEIDDESPSRSALPSARDARLARLEAVLFVAREPLNTRKLAQLASLIDGTEARGLLRRLNRLYDAENRSFRAEEVAGGFQLRTRPQFGPWLRKILHARSGVPGGGTQVLAVKLSGPALETLSVVAYRQPVLRAEIDSIRGVDSSELLRQLMDRDLVRLAGRSADLGRPYLYGTTRRFLQVFGLRNLDDLPRAAALRSRGEGVAETANFSESKKFPRMGVANDEVAAKDTSPAPPASVAAQPTKDDFADDFSADDFTN